MVAILAAVAYPSYTSCVQKTRCATAGACLTNLAGTCGFSFTANPTASAYALQSVLQGPQMSDTRCGTLTLTQVGAKGAAAATRCWN